MNDIERKPFLIFKSRDSYEQAKAREEVRDDAIVFIREDGTIWTHGYMFGGAVEHAKGFFKSVDLLPSGTEGDWAIVKVDDGWYIYTYNSNNSLWEQTELYNIPSGPIDLDETYSEFESAMMEKIANTLTDYYTKSQTYSKTEVNRLVSLIPTYLTKVVLELPTNDDIEPNVIYIVKDPDDDTSFIEYIYNNDQWIELSRQINNISLDGSYVTFEQMQKYVREHAAEATTDNIPNHIILEQSTYEALTSYEDNTLYFVLEPRENINWTFGGTFPITFGSLGLGVFPITLN